MFKKKKPEKTPEEELTEVNARLKQLDYWMENGGRDMQHPDDQRVRESLMNLASALEGKIDAKRNEPPKEAGLWSRMMRR